MYSVKELTLINSLGYGYLAGCRHPVEPLVIYRMMRDKCFMDQIHGPIADSVRGCLKAFDMGSPRRNTHEWDELILL